MHCCRKRSSCPRFPFNAMPFSYPIVSYRIVSQQHKENKGIEIPSHLLVRGRVLLRVACVMREMENGSKADDVSFVIARRMGSQHSSLPQRTRGLLPRHPCDRCGSSHLMTGTRSSRRTPGSACRTRRCGAWCPWSGWLTPTLRISACPPKKG